MLHPTPPTSLRSHYLAGSGLWLALGLCASPAAGQLTELPVQSARPPAQDVIYYDAWEGGRLQGGVIQVNPNDPQHTDLGPSKPIQGAAGQPGGGGTNVVTLVDHGPPSNRLDFVYVGDGYTAGQQNTFANHVNSIYPVFFDEHPFDDYFPYFNVHRVDVISNESGVDNDPVQGISKDTALDMGYWCGGVDRLLCVNVGQAKSWANLAPGRDQVLAVANSSTYGGAGYPSSDLGTLAGNNSAAIEIALHEAGHSMGNLADEYNYASGDFYPGGEPSSANLTTLSETQMANQGAKWHLWLPEGNVGTFEGGGYWLFDIFRPTNNSLMNNLFRPFEQVNSEQLIIEIYKLVDPIDDATPPGTYFDGEILFVAPMQPVGHSLDVEWLVDGVVVPGLTTPSLDTLFLGLDSGIYTVTARVTDNTPMVRNESLRAQYMTSERSWTLAASDDIQPPLVQSFNSIQAASQSKVAIHGFFLGDVTEVSIDGVPAFIGYQDFATLEVYPTVPGTPGYADLEVVGPEGTVFLPDALEQFPILDASTTGVGGVLDLDIRIHDVTNSVGWYSLAFGVGVLTTPLPLPGIDYGLVLDPFLPVGSLGSNIMITTQHLSFPIPPDPTLSGATVYLQSWTQLGFFNPTQSFTNVVPLTF